MNIHEYENNEYSWRSKLANFNICTLTLMENPILYLGQTLSVYTEHKETIIYCVYSNHLLQIMGCHGSVNNFAQTNFIFSKHTFDS